MYDSMDDGLGGTERARVLVIGGGQAGLSVGRHLARLGVRFLILDANERVGDAWRRRWDSLRLFTPAAFDGLDGMPWPSTGPAFPTKDEMADYLEAYAARFALPVRTGVPVDGVHRDGDGYLITAGARRFRAEHVVVAMANFQRPRLPAFARELDEGIVQLHSRDYRNPMQLREGGVLVVGAGNSGAEIAKELVLAGRRTWLAGRGVGEIPWRTDGRAARLLLAPLLFRVVFHRLLTTSTPIGRRVRAQGHATTPLIRVKERDLRALGVERLPKVAGTRAGMPLLEDGRVLRVENVVWCTGFEPGFSWLRLPVFDDRGEPVHENGVVTSEPGLYFVGLHFLRAMSSAMVHGVGRDAAHVAAVIRARVGPRAAVDDQLSAIS